jgi:DNA-binding transcriptional MocR family regulator
MVKIAPTGGGTNILVRFNQAFASEANILKCAVDAMLPATSTKHYYCSSPAPSEFLISIAHLDEAKIDDTILAFRSLLRHDIQSNSGMVVPAPDVPITTEPQTSQRQQDSTYFA